MRRTLVAVVMGAMVLVGSACQPAPTEPAMTITAKSDVVRPGCGSIATVSGTVSPAGATKKVVLQRTVGGKWQDWKPTAAASVQGSTYKVVYTVPFSTSTLHLRVRSDGATKFSNGIYVTPTEYDAGQC